MKLYFLNNFNVIFKFYINCNILSKLNNLLLIHLKKLKGLFNDQSKFFKNIRQNNINLIFKKGWFLFYVQMSIDLLNQWICLLNVQLW